MFLSLRVKYFLQVYDKLNFPALEGLSILLIDASFLNSISIINRNNISKRKESDKPTPISTLHDDNWKA